MSVDQIAYLRERITADRAAAKDERALIEADLKTAILDIIESRRSPETRPMANDLVEALLEVYAQYVTTKDSDRYHAAESCPWFRAGYRGVNPIVRMSREQAVRKGMTACPCVTAT